MDESYLDIIKKNNNLGEKLGGSTPYKIGVLSNVVVNQLKEPLEFVIRSNNINALIDFGDYDNILQDSLRFKSHQALIIFWEASNLVDGFQYKSLSMPEIELAELIPRIKSEIKMTMDNLRNVPLLVINKFSSLLFNQHFIRDNQLDKLVKDLNKYLEETLPENVFLFDADKVMAQIGTAKAFNRRFWYSSKMLYTTDFLKVYAKQVAPIFLNILGKSKKALILDCDNTLWKGIIGEDLIDGVAFSKNQKDGIYFEEVQYLAKALSAKGIVLGLNSKNNAEDVEAVFRQRTDSPLKSEDFLVKKINWQDKVSNLKEIANDLNIGIDSLVQVDDSDFEINYVQTELPLVETVQVPKAFSDYPEEFRKKMNLFFNLKTTKEDASRVQMYKEQQHRDEGKNKFQTLEDYLKSLELEITIRLNDKTEIARIAQMTQKTNQFNLTTIRYTENEIEQRMRDGKHYVFSLGLKDKFGDYGTTGVCIIDKESNATATIDSFLMSCRIIGRNVEKAFFDFLISYLISDKITLVKASYLKTLKNSQVENLYERLNLSTVRQEEKKKEYQLKLEKYQPTHTEYIKIEFKNLVKNG